MIHTVVYGSFIRAAEPVCTRASTLANTHHRQGLPARTFEAPGVGATGQAFVDSLRAKSGGRSVDVYAVNYPASLDFAMAANGVIDASNRLVQMAGNCPDTKMVLGGYSQGAAVAAYLTEDAIPEGTHRRPG